MEPWQMTERGLQALESRMNLPRMEPGMREDVERLISCLRGYIEAYGPHPRFTVTSEDLALLGEEAGPLLAAAARAVDEAQLRAVRDRAALLISAARERSREK